MRPNVLGSSPFSNNRSVISLVIDKDIVAIHNCGVFIATDSKIFPLRRPPMPSPGLVYRNFKCIEPPGTESHASS